MLFFMTKKSKVTKVLSTAEVDGVAADSQGSDVDLDLVITQPVATE